MPEDAPATVAPDAIRSYDDDAPAPTDTETATVGLGCFWGPDSRFGGVDGVVRTRVGYAGGSRSDPTYHALGDHTEVVQIDFEPRQLAYADLLDLVFRSHDPHNQVPKPQYQYLVLYDGPAQERVLRDVLEDHGLDPEAIGTRIEPLEAFYLAEDYHQKYNLRSDPWLSGRFEDAGYDDTALRESPAAAKLNAHAAGHGLPDDDRLARAASTRP